MSTVNKRQLLQAGLIVFAAFFSRDLFTVWQDDPFSTTAPFCFLVWIAAISHSIFTKKTASCSLTTISSTLALTALSVMTDLSVLAHAALATAVSGLLVSTNLRVVALVTAFSWFPATGWIGHSLLDTNIDGARLPFFLCSLLTLELMNRLHIDRFIRIGSK